MSRGFAASALSLATVFLLSAVNPVLADQKPAKPGAKAILEVEFTFSGAYSDSGDLGSTDWKVNRHFKATFELRAQELAKFGFLDQSHQVEMLPETQALGEQGQQMANNNADMMARAEAIVAECGEDEACIERKVIELSQDPNAQPGLNQLSSDGQAMSNSVEAWDSKSPPRYQLWKDPNNKAPKGKGSASIKKVAGEEDLLPDLHGGRSLHRNAGSRRDTGLRHGYGGRFHHDDGRGRYGKESHQPVTPLAGGDDQRQRSHAGRRWPEDFAAGECPATRVD